MSIFKDFFHVKQSPMLSMLGFGGGGTGTALGGGVGATASGGNISAQPGGDGYNYHVFTSSGSLLVENGDITGCELLVIGPGGGGAQGNGSSGGGGAGGVVHATGHILVAGTYTIAIPDGGDGGSSSHPNPGPMYGQKGANTTMISSGFNITANPGGGGQAWGSSNNIPAPISNGGSGGGASGNPSDLYGTASQPGTPYTVASGSVTRYGNPGGPDGGWPASGSYRGSGGGGAGGVGSNHNAGAGPIYGGQGGNGQPFTGFVGPNPAFAPMPSDWKTAVGPTGLFAGGGAGGSESGGTTTASPGGPGGGGDSGAGPPSAGQSTNNGDPGVNNTGSGGGAGWWYGSYSGNGGDGGKGIVLVRYPS